MPKATYMYWQKRFDRENPDKELEEKIIEIQEVNKDYGYRRTSFANTCMLLLAYCYMREGLLV